MRKNLTILLSVVLAVPLFACGQGPAELVVGLWQSADDSGDPNGQMRFTEDGLFSFDELPDSATADHVTGTYTATDDTLLIDATTSAGLRQDVEFTYYVNDTEFAFGALLAAGSTDGIVGTWAGHIKVVEISGGDTPGAINGSTTSLVIAADGTADFTATPFDGSAPLTYSGTYVLTATGYDFTFSAGEFGSFSTSYELLDGAALANSPMVRL